MDYAKLRKKVESNKLGVSGLFKKLNMGRGTFYYSLEHETLKVKTLERICEIIEVPITEFFTAAPQGPALEQTDVQDPAITYSTDDADCAQVRRINRFLEQRHKEDRETIELLLSTLKAFAGTGELPAKTITQKKNSHKS